MLFHSYTSSYCPWGCSVNREVLLLLHFTRYQPIGSYVGVFQNPELNRTQRKYLSKTMVQVFFFFYSADISIACCMSHEQEHHFPHFYKQKKSSVTWFTLRLGRVSSPSRRIAVGWQRAPAVRGVQGKHFDSTHHTPPSIHLHPVPPAIQPCLSWCLIQVLSRGRLTAVWGNYKPALAGKWMFFYCALGEAIKPPSKGTKTAYAL